MIQNHSSSLENILVQLSPCISLDQYPFDLAKTITQQSLDVGIKLENIHDCNLCTASDLSSFYSYRKELGKTGRHLAVIGWKK